MRQPDLARLRRIPTPNLWPEIERRLEDQGSAARLSRRHSLPRLVVVVFAFAVAAAGVGAVFVAFAGHGRAPEVQRTIGVFPGGGRILFAQNGGGIAWAYPDGSVRRVADGFYGARLFPGFPGGGGQLLAWKVIREEYDYYVMGSDGSRVRHVLAPGPVVNLPGGYGIPGGYEAVQVSPDGTKLAYLRFTSSQVGPTNAQFELMVEDLQTGKTTDAGSAGPFTSCCVPVVWNDDSALILMQGSRGQSVDWVNIDDLTRGTYLRVSDPRVISAYEKAWSGVGAPTEIAPIGWSPDPNVPDLAVLASQEGGRRPAILVLRNDRAVGFATRDGQPNLSFTWGAGGRFVLLSYVEPRTGGKTASLYLGSASTGGLRHVVDVNHLTGGPLFSPTAPVFMSYEAGGPWEFVASPGGSQAVTVPRFHGYPLDWGL